MFNISSRMSEGNIPKKTPTLMGTEIDPMEEMDPTFKELVNEVAKRNHPSSFSEEPGKPKHIEVGDLKEAFNLWFEMLADADVDMTEKVHFIDPEAPGNDMGVLNPVDWCTKWALALYVNNLSLGALLYRATVDPTAMKALKKVAGEADAKAILEGLEELGEALKKKLPKLDDGPNKEDSGK